MQIFPYFPFLVLLDFVAGCLCWYLQGTFSSLFLQLNCKFADLSFELINKLAKTTKFMLHNCIEGKDYWGKISRELIFFLERIFEDEEIYKSFFPDILENFWTSTKSEIWFFLIFKSLWKLSGNSVRFNSFLIQKLQFQVLLQ